MTVRDPYCVQITLRVCCDRKLCQPSAEYLRALRKRTARRARRVGRVIAAQSTRLEPSHPEAVLDEHDRCDDYPWELFSWVPPPLRVSELQSFGTLRAARGGHLLGA